MEKKKKSSQPYESPKRKALAQPSDGAGADALHRRSVTEAWQAEILLHLLLLVLSKCCAVATHVSVAGNGPETPRSLSCVPCSCPPAQQDVLDGSRSNLQS